MPYRSDKSGRNSGYNIKMHKAERLFRLILLLRGGRVVTAQELSRDLEVSERTVYRDVQSLILSGIPIEGEAGVGYVLRKGMELPPLMFSNEEAKALALGARMVRAWGDAKLEKAAKQVIEKIEAVAPPAVRDELARQTLVAPQFHIDPLMRERLGEMREAIDERRKVRITYTRADGGESKRTIRPLGLFFWGQTWSCGAWCELRKAFRNFRIDRITALELRADTFDITEKVSLAEFIRCVEDS